MTSGFDRNTAWAILHLRHTSPDQLAAVAERFPEFAATIADHPNAYPALRAWARAMDQDPDGTLSTSIAPFNMNQNSPEAPTLQVVGVAPAEIPRTYSFAGLPGAAQLPTTPPFYEPAGYGVQAAGGPGRYAAAHAQTDPDRAARRSRSVWLWVGIAYAILTIANIQTRAFLYSFEFQNDIVRDWVTLFAVGGFDLALLSVAAIVAVLVTAPTTWRKVLGTFSALLATLSLQMYFADLITGYFWLADTDLTSWYLPNLGLALAYLIARPIRGAGWAALPIWFVALVAVDRFLLPNVMDSMHYGHLAFLLAGCIYVLLAALGAFMAEGLSRGAARRRTQYAALAELPRSTRTNTLAVVSLVLSFLMALPAIILGHVALSQIRRTGDGGRGLAVAGLVIGYIWLVIGIIGAMSYSIWIGSITSLF